MSEVGPPEGVPRGGTPSTPGRSESGSRAVESPFRGITAQQLQSLSVPTVMQRAEEQFQRYEDRLDNQRRIIDRLLAHHNAVHPDCHYTERSGSE